jgi:uncharacterized protein
MFQAPYDKPLPRQGDPRKFAQQGISIQGFVPVSALPRLAGALTSVEGNVQVELAFTIGDDRKRLVTGTAKADLCMECQRCLNPVSIPVESHIALALVWAEEDIQSLPKELDSWIVGEGLADFYEMIEEELLLSLPAVAYHEELCIDAQLFSSGEPVVVKQEKKNPFQVLEQLKSSPK